MRDKFKLKHLNILIEEDKAKQDLSILMIDILGYKNSFFGKTKWFFKNFIKIKQIVGDIEREDYKSIKLNKNSPIKFALSIDHISYAQMLELQSFVNNENDLLMAEHIAKIITIATYSENKEAKYESGNKSWTAYNELILNSNMFDMIGLYNFIIEDLKQTSKDWQDRFFSVEVIDKDLEKAGGQELAQFNVINTIKAICEDFNCDEKQAWEKSYYLVMTNSYSKAYASFVQQKIQVQKEAEIKLKQK